jgi:uncharacterized protein (TIGR03084 family)
MTRPSRSSRPSRAGLLADLVAEEAELAAVLAPLDAYQWDRATPAAGWQVRDQVAHLATGEDLATLAATDERGFTARLAELMTDLDAVEVGQRARARGSEPSELLAWWTGSAAATVRAVSEGPEDERIAWITGPMSVASFITARLMETWAHGQDIVDGIGQSRTPTARLRHIADLGVRTRGFSFRNRGLTVPDPEPRVDLVGPSGERWGWGPDDASELVSGTAEDFCLVVTQRRHVDDTALSAWGAGAVAWLDLAQCFAGPPTTATRREG